MKRPPAEETQWMKRAIALSKRGYPAPNPHVGCVIVKRGRVIGEGFHAFAGGDHAEVVALKQAGAEARGAKVFVTLEPCKHAGRTPPCTHALIKAGIESVSIACHDPNPEAAGGVKELVEAGIRVETGLLEVGARRENELFLTAAERGWPFVVAKVAMSLDGRIALPSGESKWITSEIARKEGRKLRAECGAVLVGQNTIRHDNPLLTDRVRTARNPAVRIILDPNQRLTGYENTFDASAPTWHCVRKATLPTQIELPMAGSDVDLPKFLKKLYEAGLTSLLVEGGPTTLGHFLDSGLVDRLELFIAPKALGSGPSWCSSENRSLQDAFQFRLERVRRVGPDLWQTFRPQKD